jgi:hypothetical protein
MHLRRDFLVLVALGLAVSPVCAQTVAATAEPAAHGAKQSTASIPDFSGVWNHSIPGFEPLASGPTALVNRERRPNGTGNILKLVGDYTNPILKPQAAEIVKKHAELGLKASETRTRAINVGPQAGLSSLPSAQRCCCKHRTRSPYFMATIIRSVRCA